METRLLLVVYDPSCRERKLMMIDGGWRSRMEGGGSEQVSCVCPSSSPLLFSTDQCKNHSLAVHYTRIRKEMYASYVFLDHTCLSKILFLCHEYSRFLQIISTT